VPAKKARFFEVTIRDGHQPRTRVVPAFSKGDLLGRLHLPRNEKLLRTNHLDHHEVEAYPNGDDDVAFVATVRGEEIHYSPGDQGYDYLRQQFSSQVRKVEDFLASKNCDEA
jgi:hypothetical protein